MSISDYLEDGADYYNAYSDDCYGDCDSCHYVDCYEHPQFKEKIRQDKTR